MSEPSSQLRDLLSEQLLGGSYDPNSIHREKFLIDHLVESLEEMELGDIELSELRSRFRRHLGSSFDLDAFLRRWEAAGVYDLSETD